MHGRWEYGQIMGNATLQFTSSVVDHIVLEQKEIHTKHNNQTQYSQ